MADHDSGYHLLFSNPKMVEDLFRSFVPEPWVKQLDFATLHRENAKLHADNLDRREGDIIYRVSHTNGTYVYLYLLLEFQSKLDHWMVVRVGTYVFLLYQHLIREKQITEESGLPPVFPLVLYNGDQPWEAATDLSKLLALPEGTPLRAWQPNIRYYLLEERRYSETKGNSLSALLFAMENCRHRGQLAQLVKQVANHLTHPQDAPLRRAFLVWLKHVLAKKRAFALQLKDVEDLVEVHDMLATRLDQWEEEILEKGESTLLGQMLEHRFGPLPDWAQDKLTQADSQTLERWGLQLLDAGKLEDVFK